MNPVWDWITGGIVRLLVALKLAAATIVGRVLSAYGLSLVTFDALLPDLKAFVTQHVAGMPAESMAVLGALGVGQVMSWILSALTIRMAWKVFIIPKSVADTMGAGT